MTRKSQPYSWRDQLNLGKIFLVAIALISVCGCERKMSQEEADKAVATFKGGPLRPNEAEIMAKERAAAAAYRKEHPEKFPPFTK